MPPTLVAIVGSSTANSYVTRAEFAAYLDARLVTATATAAAGADQDRALIQATRRIDEEEFVGQSVYPLNGMSTSTTQALKWPRYGALNEDGFAYESTVIPQAVKNAVMELAIGYLNSGATDAQADTGLEAFDEVTVGPITVKPRGTRRADTLPQVTLRPLRHLLETPIGNLRFVKG
jgi:hypothetical protein